MKARASPDRDAALAQYRRRAAIYDLELALLEPVRRRAIEALGLQRGKTVLDVACGTGLSFEGLRAGVGAGGQVVGIEQSPEMIALARDRVKGRRWRNVRLIPAPVEAAEIDVSADAALFHFTHDVLRRPEAVANVLRHLRPGARVVASGLKWAGRRSPVNLLVWPVALHSVTSLEGLSRPWSHLQPALEDFHVRSTLLGGVYIASGTLRRP